MILPLLMHLMAISVVVVCAVVGANSTCTSARPSNASNEVAHWATKGSPEPRRVTKLADPITRLARSGAGVRGGFADGVRIADEVARSAPGGGVKTSNRHLVFAPAASAITRRDILPIEPHDSEAWRARSAVARRGARSR